MRPASRPARRSSNRIARSAMASTAAAARRSARTSIRARPRYDRLFPSLTDGQIFTFVHDGIRNTAMPAWNFTDNKSGKSFCSCGTCPPTAAQASEALTVKPGSHYVGSAACQSCHQEIYARWQKTRMANVVRDPRAHPDAIIPDFSKPDPLLTFTKDDIAFVYGSRWKQRYFTRRGDDYFPLQAQWDITHHRWLPITCRQTPTGGCPSIRPTTCSGRPALSATGAIRSITTSPRKT